jgi:hypothetical protein
VRHQIVRVVRALLPAVAVLSAACSTFKQAASHPACPAPGVDESKWNTKTGPDFSFQMSDDYRKAATVGFDVPAAQWSNGPDNLIRWTLGNAPVAAEEVQSAHGTNLNQCTETIGGREAHLATYQFGAKYYARAVWPGFGAKGEALMFFAESKDPENQAAALTVMRTVRFKQ